MESPSYWVVKKERAELESCVERAVLYTGMTANNAMVTSKVEAKKGYKYHVYDVRISLV